MLNDFKENFFGGTRSNRFEIEGIIPTGGSFTKFHVRSSLIPQVTTKTLTYDYFGRKFHYPGEKEYGNWAFTVIDDVGLKNNLWQRFQKWHDSINQHDTNISTNISKDRDFKAYNWKIRHFDINGENILKEFLLQGCWPTQVQQMSLNMMQPSTLNSFNVIMVYDYVEITNITIRA